MTNNRGQAVLWWIVGIIVLVIVVALLIPYLNRGDVRPDTDVTVSDIVLNSEEYLDQTVTVEGEIERYIGTNAFVLDSVGAVDDKILVVNRSTFQSSGSNTAGTTTRTTTDITSTTTATTTSDVEMEFVYEEGENVSVRGTVRSFGSANIITLLGDAYDDELFEEFSDQVIIVAESVQVDTLGDGI